MVFHLQIQSIMNYSTMKKEDIITVLIQKLNERWKKLNWWQRLALGGIYTEILEILQALQRKN